jgi:hypothetical protein
MYSFLLFDFLLCLTSSVLLGFKWVSNWVQTFATLQVYHIKDRTNHNANNLQFMMGQKNSEKSNGRPCYIWEIGKKDAKKRYPSAVAAADDIGYKDASSVRDIIKNTIENNPKNKWRGEYIVE